MIFLIFWGIPSQPGSLCNMREIIRRLQVDKTEKLFNIADEFMIHAFTGSRLPFLKNRDLRIL